MCVYACVCVCVIRFSSMVVRGKAVECLSMLSDDDVYDSSLSSSR